ncbi:MAG TPA: cytochrome c biogenesis protein CcdA [Bryobacteraceae bacterium]|jgi:thiol:disulfide interchange protein DsbD
MKATAVLFLLFAVGASAQITDPVSWSMAPATAAPGGKVQLKLTAKLGEGWHLYSPTTPKGGPIPTTITLDQNPAIESYKLYQPKPDRKFDAAFGIDTETFEGDVVFVFEALVKKDAALGPAELTAHLRYQACNAKECRPPKKKTAVATLTLAAGAPTGDAVPASLIEVPPAAAPSAPATSAAVAPVKAASAQEEDLLPFLLTALGFGLASIFTPCVFPMIPITMSYFLKRESGSRSDSLIQAGIFCVGIIVLFCLLGFAATAIAGPFGVVQLSASVWVNLFISALFFVFGLSLLGAFEITLPSGLLTKMDSASRQGGTLGTLLMGLTFSLTSFACVGPFVGTLLAGSIQQKGARPLLGMMFFAIGLALPFFLLALFPGYLKKLPRSGGWLARVKVVMGFIILAAMFKYLSNIDLVMHWGLLTRDRFLAAWFVLIALAGLYLLGFLRLEGIKSDDHLGVGRLLTASAFLIFAFSLLPGMFGGRLGELDAYVPPAADNGLRSSNDGGLVWMTNQYDEALAKAKAENKLVFINFTGVTCTNCHWMRQNLFPKPEIATLLKDFVVLELYTDGTGAIDEKNQKLEESKFQTISLPYYAIVTPDQRVVATFAGLTKNPQEFVAFLKSSPAPL